jgi:hypothetical protein
MTSTKKPIRITQAKRYAEIEHISIVGIKARMGPIGLHVYSEHYLAGAQALPSAKTPFEPVRAYLICHSIELSLKTFLSIQGAAMIELAENSYGHNLQALLSRAEALNFSNLVPLTRQHLTAIQQASDYYAGKVFEYPAVGEAMSGYPKMPSIDILCNAAEILVESLHIPSREAE